MYINHININNLLPDSDADLRAELLLVLYFNQFWKHGESCSWLELDLPLGTLSAPSILNALFKWKASYHLQPLGKMKDAQIQMLTLQMLCLGIMAFSFPPSENFIAEHLFDLKQKFAQLETVGKRNTPTFFLQSSCLASCHNYFFQPLLEVPFLIFK